MPYLDIHDYGIIGDLNSCALVGINGSIDWACFPQFDSPSCFAAILDDQKGGRFSITPDDHYSVRQRYLPDTNVLETTFSTESGSVVVVDFMVPQRPSETEPPHQIHRLVRGVSGRVRMNLAFQPRLDYGRGTTQLSVEGNGIMARLGEQRLGLASPTPVSIRESADGGVEAHATFTVHEGDALPFVVIHAATRIPTARSLDTEARLRQTVAYWEATVARTHYEGLWRDEVVRSFLALHLLMYAPTGAVIAAATTSLPEQLGGERNWDYRFTWLRDAAWTVGVLYRLGDPHEGEAFMKWMVDRCWLSPDAMQVLYGIRDDSELHERELAHLEGYKESRPVRIGNDAAFHRQLDVFGEVVGSLATYDHHHGRLPDHGWELLRRLANLAAQTWQTTDRSIWEVRGPERHFVYSKLMCWVALDRAAHMAELHGYDGEVEVWRREAQRVKDDILLHGWSETKQSFVQHYGSDALDASALIMPFVGFLQPDDPRIKSTIRAVQRELATGPFVHRYLVHETDDGLEGDEGCFYMLSFWLVGALLFVGEVDEAKKLFDEVYETRNHLGLFAEMIDPGTKTALGNFPQAFSHIGFIHTARNMSQALQGQAPEQEFTV